MNNQLTRLTSEVASQKATAPLPILIAPNIVPQNQMFTVDGTGKVSQTLFTAPQPSFVPQPPLMNQFVLPQTTPSIPQVAPPPDARPRALIIGRPVDPPSATVTPPVVQVPPANPVRKTPQVIKAPIKIPTQKAPQVVKPVSVPFRPKPTLLTTSKPTAPIRIASPVVIKGPGAKEKVEMEKKKKKVEEKTKLEQNPKTVLKPPPKVSQRPKPVLLKINDPLEEEERVPSPLDFREIVMQDDEDFITETIEFMEEFSEPGTRTDHEY